MSCQFDNKRRKSLSNEWGVKFFSITLSGVVLQSLFLGSAGTKD